jgi:hypothetical protein
VFEEGTNEVMKERSKQGRTNEVNKMKEQKKGMNERSRDARTK